MKHSEKGQGLVEYALILVLVVVLVIGIPACCLLVVIPFAFPFLERAIAGAQDGSSTAIAQLVCGGIVVLATFCSIVPRLAVNYTRTIRIRRVN